MATVAETLEGLAVRCESAPGPDRELDNAVFRVIGAPVPFQFANQMVALSFDEAEQCYFAPVGEMRVRYEPPVYTTSLDAALELVPEGFPSLDILSFSLDTSTGDDPPEMVEMWSCTLKGAGYPFVPGYGRNRALALCAAALRAAAAKARADG